MEIETESDNTEIHNNLTFGIMTKLAQRHQAIDKFLKNEPKPKTQLHKRQRRIKRHKDMLWENDSNNVFLYPLGIFVLFCEVVLQIGPIRLKRNIYWRI